jgi:hypothetical protein
MAIRPWGCAALSMIVATVFFIISLTTNHWDGTGSWHKGLWEACGNYAGSGSVGDNNGCNNINADGYLNATRAMIIIATVLAAMSAILYLHAIYSVTKQGGWSAESFAFGAGIFGVIGMVIYIVQIHSGSYGYSFGLQVAAWVISLIAGTSACFLGVRSV